MNPKVGRLTVELAKKETEMQLLSQQRQDEQRQEEQRFAEQMRSQREQSAEQLRAAREQFDEQLKTTKEQLRNMAQQLMDAQAQRLKEENRESMGTITQPLKSFKIERCPHWRPQFATFICN